MAAKRLSFLTLAATLTGALGGWLSAGAITGTSSDAGVSRVALLPSAWWLALAVLLAVAITASVRTPRRLSPLFLAALAAVPWLPATAPVFLIWTGAISVWLWLAIAVAIAVPFVRAGAPGWCRRAASDPKRAPVLAAVAAATLYLSAAWAVSPRLPAGDEPHYLVITQSLLRDHDLKIENNHRQGDYRAYYGGELRPDYLKRGTDGEIYSIHAPGLSVAAIPAFALFGYPGVIVFLALLSAAATGVAWNAVWNTTGDAAASWFGWSTVALSAPFFFQSFIAYPDGPGAAIVMVAVATLIAGRTVSDRRLFATGVALAALPWLHTRFSLAAAVLAALILARSEGDRLARRAAALLTAPLVSAFAWFGFFYAIYGTPDPRAPYGGYTQSELANLVRGVPGLLVDQQFGLLPNAPVYLCAIVGFVALARRAPRLAVELALLVVPYALAVAAFYMWWGGFSSPARFLTLIVLPLAIPAGVWFQSAGGGGRVLGLGALFLTATITATIVAVDRGALLYNSRDGQSKLLLWLAPAVNLTTGLPSLFQTSAHRAVENAVVWVGAVALVVVVTLAAARRRRSDSAPGKRLAAASLVTIAGAAAAVCTMAALTLVWQLNAAVPLTADRGALALLSKYNAGSRQMAMTLSPFARLPLRALPSRLTVADVEPSTVPADEPLLVLRDLPAATYEIQATLAAPTSGQLSVTIDRTFGPQWSWRLAGDQGSFSRTMTLPVPIGAAIIDIEPAARSTVARLVVAPASGLHASEKLSTSRPEHVARYGPAVLFLMSGDGFMESAGAWIAGRSSATFVVTRDDSARLRLFMRTPPVSNHVVLEGEGWRQELSFQPGEEKLIDLPMDPNRRAETLRVTASAGARPTEFERGSSDTRFLGCWIEVR
jgi:hypothetical protein